MSEPIKLGLVGIGRAGYGMQCIEIKNKGDMFKIVAACDIIKERTDKMKQEYDCATYDNIDDLIADENVELVSVATRSRDHFAHAVKVLKAGKNVLLEKPMCETYEQALQLKELATKENGPRIYARHNRRFEYNFEKIKELIHSGILGDVYEIHITRNGYSRRDDWQTLSQFGGGQLLNWGPHIIDQSLRLMDSPIKDMTSNLKHTVAGGDCEDHLTITFLGENDRTITMQISGGMALPTPEYRVYGTKGALEIIDNKIHLKYIDPSQKLDPPVSNPGTPEQIFGSTGTFAVATPIEWVEETIDDWHEDLSIIWDYMYHAIRDGEEYPITLEQAMQVIEVITNVKKGTEFESKI